MPCILHFPVTEKPIHKRDTGKNVGYSRNKIFFDAFAALEISLTNSRKKAKRPYA